MKMRKLSLISLLLLIIMLGLTACKPSEKETEPADNEPKATAPAQEEKGGEEATDATPEPTATPTPEPPRDLGGIEVIVADWWSTGTEEEAKNQKEEDQRAYRNEMQKKHNFTLVNKNIGAWAEYQEIFITSTMSEDPVADIFCMDQKFVPEPLKQGLLQAVSDLPSFGPEDELWNKSMLDFMTQYGKIYGFTEEQNGPGLGIFFNKRFFQEAGLDPDLLYDLQKNNEWTWDKLLEVCAKLVRDDNGDGITDIYPLSAWNVEIVKCGVFSNGSDYVRFNEETGKYENNQNSDDFLAGLQFAVDLLNKGYLKPDPEGAEWTWFETAFKNAEVAMCATEWYRHTAFQDMEDDWGFVFFPAGPKGEMRTMYTGNPRVMPTGLDPQRADDVIFAYKLWVSAVPGYEDEDIDYPYYYSVTRDTRTVEETLVPMIEGKGFRSLLYQIPGLSYKYGSNMEGGGLSAMSPIEISEAASSAFDSLINDFYAEEE